MKSYIKWPFIFFFLKVEKIFYHSNFNFDCNTERGFKESLSIALGLSPSSISVEKLEICRTTADPNSMHPFQITDIFFLHTMSCMLRIIILGLEFPITHLYFSKGIQTIKRLSSNFWTPNTGFPINIVPTFISFPSHWPWIDGTPCIWKKSVDRNSIV